jgi:uroporphyrinogen decarboxylase
MMRGAEQLFKDCILYPMEVMAACEIITPVLVEFVEAQCDTGIPAIAIDTLYASRNGLSKPLWEEIEGRFVREISKAIKKKGLLVGIHNCGHDLYFDAQIRSMEPEFISFAHLPDDCGTPKELKERYGDGITLVGFVPTPLLINGSPREVMETCREQIEDLARDGGFILAPGCEYPPNIPLTNAFALVQAAERYSGRRGNHPVR